MDQFKNNSNTEDKQIRVISEVNGSEKSDFIKEAEAFNQKMIQAVKENKNVKRAFISIAVEVDEKEDYEHSAIQCVGSEDILIYSLVKFTSKEDRVKLLKLAFDFLEYVCLTKKNKKDFKE